MSALDPSTDPRPRARAPLALALLAIASCGAYARPQIASHPGAYNKHTLVATTGGVVASESKDTKDPPARADRVGVSKTRSAGTGRRRLVIYNASLVLAVFKPEEVLTKARALAKTIDGWMEGMSKNTITLRIPAAKLEGFIDSLSGLGDVLDRNIIGNDVTEQFIDLEIRLKNAERVRARLVALLTKANSVKDSVLIEKELARVTEQLERIKGKLNYLKNHIAFSKVFLRLKTKSALSGRRRKLPFYWVRSLGVDSIVSGY